MKNPLTVILIIFLGNIVLAQEKFEIDTLNFYGKLRVHTAVFDDVIELQQNSPRIGVNFRSSLSKNLYLNAKLEYGMNLVEGSQFNNDANNVIEFASQPFVKKETFSSRIAYVGVSHDRWGAITIGKQWGVYYDVASYTDNFTVFGGESNGVYSAQTDGGWKGTGRADNAVAYRNKFNNLSIGFQTQLFSANTNLGLALEYDFTSHFKLGFAFNSAKINDAFKDFIEFERVDNNNYLFGAKYKKNNFLAALTYSLNQDEFALLDTNDDSFRIIAYPTHGIELFTSYFFNDKFEFQGGFNRIHDKEKESFFNGDYTLMHYVVGLNYHINKNAIIYSSARIGDSNLVNNAKDSNVFLVGFSFNFSYLTKAFKS
ncbi:MAG: porin [Polaribacter sp.]|nr:porin [Polaribacter sp.]